MAADAGGPQSLAPVEVKRATPVNLFPVVLHLGRIDRPETLNAALLAEIARWRAAEEGIGSSNLNSWHSPRTLFSRTEPAFVQVCTAIRTFALEAIRHHWKEFDPARHRVNANGWVNVTPRGGMNAPHVHGASHLSGVYYVSTPQGDESGQCSALNFHNPAGGANPDPGFGSILTPVSSSFVPVAGQLVMFPSYLLHWVAPNEHDEERVSIAFNLSVADRQG